MKVFDILEEMKNNSRCIVKEPSTIPSLEGKFKLPADLKEFYELCGGASLFTDEEYSFEIVAPDEMVLANPVIVGELCPYDISSNWYIIAKNADNDYITIDLSDDRLGRCYDSFWDCHGIPGECAIVANSFTELLEKLYSNKGKSIYWLDPGFSNLGDAYDK